MPIRILYVVTDPISTRLLRGQLRWLVGTGFEVHLACADGPDLDDFGRSEGVAVHRLPLVREPSVAADVRALVATFRLIRRLRPTIVNASTPKAAVLGCLAARLARVPVRVLVLRGLRFEAEQGARRRLLRGFDRLAARAATDVVANSRSLLALAEDEGLLPPGVGVVLAGGSSNGVDVDRFAVLPARVTARRMLGLPEEGCTVGFVGRLTQDKGLADLVEAFGVVAEHRPDVGLLLVGGFEAGDPVEPEVRRRIEADDRILVVGWLEPADPVYAAIDVFAFPSHREGLPNVVLEAQASGVPVVAYAATGTRDAVQPGVTGLLVPTGDRRALADALVALLDNPERRRALGQAGATWMAEAFVPARLWAELATCYRTWCDRAGVPGDGTMSEPPCPA